MNRLDKNIAENLKRIRRSRNMSLDLLSEQTGVSKSMLGQIERGESHPTVSTVEKIIEGLRIPFEELFYVKEEVMIIDKSKIMPSRHKENAWQLKAIFPYDKKRNFELYEMTIAEKSGFQGGLREENSFEYITVDHGELTVEIGKKKYVITENKSIRIPAAVEHGYFNYGKEEVTAQLVLPHEGFIPSFSDMSSHA